MKIRHLLLATLATLPFFTACGEVQEVITDRNMGESCDEVHDCIPGLYCDNGVCRTLCKKDTDCSSTQKCQDGHCVNLGNGQCRTGWFGNNCVACALNFYGPECSPCPNCGSHGKCNDTLTGDGKCTCDNDYTGNLCENPITCKNGTTDISGHCKNGSCQGNWVGQDCNICPPTLWGANCDKTVSCLHGDANTDNDTTGNGACKTCDNHWIGDNCDICPVEYWGADCDKDVTCVNGDADTDITTGTGHCIDGSCKDEWSGPNCDIPNSCINNHGTPNLNTQGNGHCSSCNEPYFGPDCENENLCVNGEPDYLAIDGFGHCKEDSCKLVNGKYWAGENCHLPVTCRSGEPSVGTSGTGHCQPNSCVEDAAGIDCDKFIKCKNGTAKTNTSGDGHCSRCDNNWYGEDCDNESQCQYGIANDGINGNANCKECITGWLMPKCNDCREGYYGQYCDKCTCNSYQDCDYGTSGRGCICKTNRTGTNCSQCVAGYCGSNCLSNSTCVHGTPSQSGSCGCTGTCEGNWVGSNCDNCKSGYTAPSTNCQYKITCDESHGTVNPNNGKCISCNGGWEGENCTTCNNGYGLDCTHFGSMTDSRDGKTYKTVVINGITWMAENLRYNATSHFCPGNNSSNCETLGYMYSWNDAQNVCPPGWKLPSSSNFYTTKGGLYQTSDGKTIPVRDLLLKSERWTEGFASNATNNTGFSALPTGKCWSTASSCDYVGKETAFWSTDKSYNSGNTVYSGYSISSTYSTIMGGAYMSSETHLAVRCIKN